ncbi:MAG: GNAT family N-acetyltransferase, partial [Candidatus Binatia bacterium]
MAHETHAFRPSPLETERFGIASARLDSVDPATLSGALDACRAQGIRLLIARSDAAAHAALDAAQAEGFRIMDTILCFERRFGDRQLPAVRAAVEVRPAKAGEDAPIVALAESAFRDYVSHYQADSRLDRARVAEVYPDWTRRLLDSRDADHAMLVAESEGRIVGFHALERAGECVHLPLSAVGAGAEGKHLYQAMNLAGMAWAVARGARRMTGSVQLANTAIQRAL